MKRKEKIAPVTNKNRKRGKYGGAYHRPLGVHQVQTVQNQVIRQHHYLERQKHQNYINRKFSG